MLSPHGVAGGSSDAAVSRRPARLFVSSERKNPMNVQFERHVAHLESRQQQERRCFVTAIFPFDFFCDFKSPLHADNGNNHPSSESTSPEDNIAPSSSSPSIIFLHYSFPDGSLRKYPSNPSRLLAEKSRASSSMSNSDFLDNTFTKTSVDARHSTRRKSKKKNKKHRQRCRKPTDESENKCAESNSSTPSVDMVDCCEGLTLSPKHVGDILFEDTFSPSSSVKEASEKAPDSENDNEYNCCSVASVSSVSYSDETELSRPTTSCLELFGQCNSSNCRCWDNTSHSKLMDSSQEPCFASTSINSSDDTKTMFISGNECRCNPCETVEFCSSSDGADDNCLKKSNHGSAFCSPSGVSMCNGGQAVHLCSNGSSSDFHLVISRKRARKEKKLSMWKSSNGENSSAILHGRNERYTSRSSRQTIKEPNTQDCLRRQDLAGSILPQHGLALKHASLTFIHKPSNGIPSKNSESGSNQSQFMNPNKNSSKKSNRDFDKEQNVTLNKRLPKAVCSRESSPCEIRSNSASEPTSPKSENVNCTSKLVKSTDLTEGPLPTQKTGLQASLPVNYTTGTGSELLSPDYKSSQNLDECGTIPSMIRYPSFREFCSSEMLLVEIIKVVNDAYEVQVALDVNPSAHPITNLETFICSATPVIGHLPCMKISCSHDQFGSNSVCQHYMSNISLRNIWEWYEEPGCYGLEVRDLNDLGSKTSRCNSSEFCAYFVPYLSAIQLFGWSLKNMDSGFGESSNTTSSLSNTFLSELSFTKKGYGELLFEYFETEQPSFRPPLFEKIKELGSSLKVSSRQTLADHELQNMKLCDLHPASWYCVAWYPVYRVPHGNFRAAFMTYHSLGKLVPQKCSPTGQHMRIVSPVVGLQSYNDKGEQWFQLTCPESSKAICHEVVKERLRTLKRGALAMARAVVPKGSGESSVNHHPDYEFFLSRST